MGPSHISCAKSKVAPGEWRTGRNETLYLPVATATAQPRLIKVVLCKGYTRSRRVMLLNQQSVGSEEATPPPRQTTARNPQPAVTPLDSHQAPRWHSETNIPPTDRLFRDAPSQDSSWKRDVGKEEPACDGGSQRPTPASPHSCTWGGQEPEQRSVSLAVTVHGRFSPLMFGRRSNIVANFCCWRGLR